ncbi:transcription elongation factor GreA [Candidatus Parcubacteria bacterium]|nr:transcription elongation factor GreA [Patescibacteria group bacterium]MBU4482068.1 transcription elongation factor GreA [Patescibacteria group bacterium]MCG2686812.1 transcription elongation factor GreA [Candidatus Parcubacteria bacterium]
MPNTDTTYITKTGFEKLKLELKNLISIKRREIAEKINQAKEFGDLKENAEYIGAKNEQAFVEGRIAELNYVLKNATLIEETESNGVVKVGSKIKIEDELGELIKEYKIVGREEADPSAGLISNESPIGNAFLGKKIGEIVEINVPKGIMKYKIIEVN